MCVCVCMRVCAHACAILPAVLILPVVSVTEENSRDVPQGGADEGGEEEVEVDIETAEVAGG